MYGPISALGTVEHGSVLPIHEVHNFRLISEKEIVPLLLGHNLVFPPIVFLGFHVRLLDDSVQVLMEPVKKISDELP